jgi:hypothetical protein
VQLRAVEQRRLGELARLEPQRERDVHAAEIEPARDLRVPDHQPARVDALRRPAQIPDVRRVDRPVPEVAPTARSCRSQQRPPHATPSSCRKPELRILPLLRVRRVSS